MESVARLSSAERREVIEAQPDDASYEVIMHKLAFERMIDRGLADVRAGRNVSHDEVLRRIRSGSVRVG